MHGIKILQQDFALKRQGGLCTRGGVFAGHYSISHSLEPGYKATSSIRVPYLRLLFEVGG